MTIDLPPYLHTIVVPTPFPVGPVNLYLAEGEQLTLVDTGPRFDPARQALKEGLETLGFRPSDLNKLILTHTHSDHCGLAAELAAASGAEVFTHPTNFATLADYADERERRLAFYGGIMEEAGVPPEEIARIERVQKGYGRFTEPIQPDGPLVEGTQVQLGDESWRVLHTPGHAGGLICLYQPQRRLLLSSDHLLGEISSNPVVEPPHREGEPRPKRLLEYVTQLERVAQLPVDLALPAHGPPIANPRQLISSRVTFHEQRSQDVLKALHNGPATIYEITKTIFPRLDSINRFLALSEVIGHLDWLQAQGKVQSELEGSVQRWQGCS